MVEIMVRFTDSVAVTVGVEMKVLIVLTMLVSVTVVAGSVTVWTIWLGVGVAMSRQLQASEIPARPDVVDRLRRHLGFPKTCLLSMPKLPYAGAVMYAGRV